VAAVDFDPTTETTTPFAATSTGDGTEPIDASVSCTEREAPKAELYVVADTDRTNWLELHEVAHGRLADSTVEVPEIAAPMHFNQFVRRFKNAWDRERAGDRSRDSLREVAQHCHESGHFVVEGEFLYLDGSRSATGRDRSELPTAERRIDFIAPEELEAALLQVVRDGVCVDEGAAVTAVTAVTTLFGVARTAQDMNGALDHRRAGPMRSADLIEVGFRYAARRQVG
jgi:hypothetical protein